MLTNAQINIQWALCAIVHQKQMPDNLQLLFILILSDVRYQLKCVFFRLLCNTHTIICFGWTKTTVPFMNEWVSECLKIATEIFWAHLLYFALILRCGFKSAVSQSYQIECNGTSIQPIANCLCLNWKSYLRF